MKLYSRRAVSICICALIFCGGFIGSARAAFINYGDSPLISPGVKFLQVTESSGTDGVPLFGPPSYSPHLMQFMPKGFVASSTGGTTDVTDGQLNYTVSGNTPQALIGINTLSVIESGDFTLAGAASGTAATQVLAGVIFHVTVTEVDGVAITPISFSSDESVAFNFLANPGIVQPWNLGAGVSIAAELAAQNVSFTVGATRVEVSMDNQLLAFSELQTAAFISKKAFDVSFITDGPVSNPEPSALAILGFVPLMIRRGRNRVAGA